MNTDKNSKPIGNIGLPAAGRLWTQPLPPPNLMFFVKFLLKD
jgi:hypothetical protein